MNYILQNTMRSTPESKSLCGVSDALFAPRTISFTWS